MVDVRDRPGRDTVELPHDPAAPAVMPPSVPPSAVPPVPMVPSALTNNAAPTGKRAPTDRVGPEAPGKAQGPTTSSTAALRRILFEDSAPDVSNVRIVDTPTQRVHHPTDLVLLIAAALGLALVLFLSTHAQGTTEDVTGMVHGFSSILGDIFFVPMSLLTGLVTVAVPVAVVAELAWQRLGRQVVEALVAAVVGLALGVTAYYLIRELGTAEFIAGLSVLDANGQPTVFNMPMWVPPITAMLVVAGPGTRRRTVRWSWRLLIVAVAVLLLTNLLGVPAAFLTLLLGAMVGHAVRYVTGIQSERAYGPTLVLAVRRAGFEPTALVRVRTQGQGPVSPSLVGTSSEAEWAMARSSDSPAQALARVGDARVYAMIDDEGARFDVTTLDGDRQVVGVVARWWRALRLRGLEGRAAVSLKALLERNALLCYAAQAAGVRTPRLLGVGMAEDSAVLVTEHARGTISLRDLPDSDLEGSRGDAILAEAWRQLRLAHDAGLTHHHLTPDVVLVGISESESAHPAGGSRFVSSTGPTVWLTGWDQGEVASSTLARRLDLTQMLAMLALRVGAERAVASAARVLPDADIAAIGPLLQTVALPAETRLAVRGRKGLMDEMRTALVDLLPDASVEPQKLARFGARTIITLALTIIAVGVVVTTINFDQIREAVAEANPWWVAAAFGFAAATWVGAALTLTAFSPGRIKLIKSVLAQMAGSFVALATPAGIGPAALNMRFLNRQGVATSMGLAIVALMQTSQIVVTVVVLTVLTLTTGTEALVSLPSNAVLLAIGIGAVVLVALMLVPLIRQWVWSKVQPTLAQLWPRLSQMLSQPVRLSLGLGGNLLMSLGYVLAFNAALNAFGQYHLPIVDVAVIYLVGNTLGALIPTPGGLVGVEGALIAGLSAAGVPGVIAVSVTLLFRVISYWVRVPIGWVAMRYLERHGDL